MKRFVIAIVLVVTAVSISVGAEYLFFSRTELLINSMTDLLNAVDTGSKEEINEQLDKVMHNWERSTKILHVILIHTSMDEIEININSLSEFLAVDDTDSFRQSCTQALQQLKNLQSANRLTVENIF